MFLKILLGVLLVQIVYSKSDNATAEYDAFIPLTANPVKDEFDWKLLQKFTSSKGYKNVIISPISLKLVLALLYEGSAGLTEKEFQRILKFPADKTSLRQEFSNLLDALIEKRQSYIINVGTRLFLDSHFDVEQAYRAKAHDFYNADVRKTNFSNSHEASTNINTWVKYLTNGIIKSFVKPDDIENAVLLVANAVYFKGLWSVPFPTTEMLTGGFYASGNEIVNVPYMKLTEQFYYYDSKKLDAHMLRIPYKGGRFAFYIILPHSRGGLSYLIDNLDLREVTMSARFMDSRPVEVLLPKFKFDFETRFSHILREFGFDTLFRGMASFPGIVRDSEAQLVVTDILQKTGLEVNEEGSVVYTATQVSVGNKLGGEKPVHFNVSHPFMFFIQEEIGENILFIGKIENPLDTESDPFPSRYGGIGDGGLVVPPSQPVESTLDSQFDIDLLKNSIGTSKNVFLSPASVKVSLAMLAEGATGNTATQIYNALKVPTQLKNQLLQRLVNELYEVQQHSILDFQNALFVSRKEKIKPQYQVNAENYYKALVKQIDYDNRETAAYEINSFVKNATRGQIPSIITSAEIDPTTYIILTNALYFKGSWHKTFENKLTRIGCFHTPKGCVDAPIMQIIDTFHYIQTRHAHIVQLNYTGDSRAMLLVVPKHVDGLLDAVNDLKAAGSFAELINSLNASEVDLTLPRFDIEYTYNIADTLQKMGITEVFSVQSSLSNLLESGKSTLVDRFIHKAKVEVNEEGTEASASSLLPIMPLMGSTTPKVRADRPFVFFIFNTNSKTILFEGILAEPESGAAPETKTGNNYLNSDQNKF